MQEEVLNQQVPTIGTNFKTGEQCVYFMLSKNYFIIISIYEENIRITDYDNIVTWQVKPQTHIIIQDSKRKTCKSSQNRVVLENKDNTQNTFPQKGPHILKAYVKLLIYQFEYPVNVFGLNKINTLFDHYMLPRVSNQVSRSTERNMHR